MPSPRPTSRGQAETATALILGLLAVVGLVGAVLVTRPGPSNTPDGSDRPSNPPAATPSAAPTAVPATPVPSVAPSVAPTAGPISVVLDNATDHDVRLLIHDDSGNVIRAVSGAPGDGMSVRWHDSIVEDRDDHTIVITWVALPQDDQVDLGVAFDDDGYHLTLVQAGPVPYSDAMGEDRILVLTFDAPVDADDVSVEILDRTVD